MSQSTRTLYTSAWFNASPDRQLVDDFGTIYAPSPEQVDHARRYVAGMATDADDARTLLAMLGLEEA